MSDEQKPAETKEEKPAEAAPVADVTGAETLVLPREEVAPVAAEAPVAPVATDADAKADDLSAEELGAATAPTPKEILEEQNPSHFSRISKRTAS